MALKTKAVIGVVAVVGYALIVAGAALIYPPAGLLVGGVLLLTLGWLALDALGANT